MEAALGAAPSARVGAARQLAAAHYAAMRLLAHTSQSLPPVEHARLTNASARMMQVYQEGLLAFFAQRSPATVLLEACGSAHYWARQLQPFGHSVRLLSPHDVRPYVRRNKTDHTDAKGLLESTRCV